MSKYEVRSIVIPAQAGIQTVLPSAFVGAKTSWIPARAALGRNDGSGGDPFLNLSPIAERLIAMSAARVIRQFELRSSTLVLRHSSFVLRLTLSG